MKVYRTKGGYYYKELKNGKKTRISKDVYNKLRKKQTGKGLFDSRTCRMCRYVRTSNETHRASKLNIDTYLQYVLCESRTGLCNFSEANVKTESRGRFLRTGANENSILKVCDKCFTRVNKYNLKSLKIDTDNKRKTAPCSTCSGTGSVVEIVHENSVTQNSGAGPVTVVTDAYKIKAQCDSCKGTGKDKLFRFNTSYLPKYLKTKNQVPTVIPVNNM